ncbi:uncharacterized protein MKK02DRAFT_45276 [Dioszegia hungarica]|uniref:F-box domain-containing protein n=1 Tax=Dioszegia hungarica TaxID=4972 RepID=A0AA38LWI8_9TREE|nr:uncharacterized protein MKK02DRAFT_45276 [Dioszegia hungarica]KAI9636571.1 hypothetical protein MKK02DRAFT_45276 [Dioszegia hungarica]
MGPNRDALTSIHSIPTSHPPVTSTLTSLPHELISQVIGYLDQSSCLALSRVSRIFTSATEQGIWGRLNLYLPPYFGTYPLHTPELAGRAGQPDVWATKEPSLAEERHEAGLADKVSKIVQRADANPRRWAMVEHVHIIPRSEAIEGIVDILVNTTNLQSLEVDCPQDNNFFWRRSSLGPDDLFEPLDLHLLSAGLRFPSLTHVRLGAYTIRNIGFLPLLCNSAPHILSLDVNIDHTLYGPEIEEEEQLGDEDLVFPQFKRNTKIEVLRIALHDNCDRETSEDDDDDEESEINDTIISSFQRIPSVKKISLTFTVPNTREAFYNRMMASIQSYRFLEDLDIEEYDLNGYLPSINALAQREDGTTAFPALRRLGVMSREWPDAFGLWIAIPSLEIILLDCFSGGPPSGTRRPSIDPVVYHMFPTFADQIRCASRLRLLSLAWDVRRAHSGPDGGARLRRLADIEALGGTDNIRSYRQGGSELLHAQILMHHRQVSDLEYIPEIPPLPRDSSLQYDRADGSRREVAFERVAEPMLQHWTDYDGKSVPLDIIERMRVVEGLDPQAWCRRGLEVGEAALKVLTDYLEGE